jgi:small subunit ribosomal protein S4
LGPKEKRERALGMSLGLKGERSGSPKSALVRKPYKPGVHGPNGRHRALSEFGLQLREKSKFKLTYGVDENNLKRPVHYRGKSERFHRCETSRIA